jgi:hypothetical protein
MRASELLHALASAASGRAQRDVNTMMTIMPAAITSDDVIRLSLIGLRGLTEYDPSGAETLWLSTRGGA